MDRKEEIKELLKKSGLTIDFLADQTGFPRQEISYQLERGMRMNMDLYLKCKAVLEPFIMVEQNDLDAEFEKLDAQEKSEDRFSELEDKLHAALSRILLLEEEVKKLKEKIG